jgi:hypothetical protein
MMRGRSAECEAVLKRYGLERSSMAVIGADRLPEFCEWRVMVTGDERPEYLEIAVAVGLVMDLRRIGEMMLAERLSTAVETAKGRCGRRNR